MRLAPILLAFVLLISYGVAEGVWTDRWQVSHAVEDAAGKIQALPLKLDDWEARAHELDPREAALGGVVGHTRRHYVHRSTGANLTVLLLCGLPGPMSVHTPEICYPGAGYAQVGEATRKSIDAGKQVGSADFWMVKFRKPGPAAEAIRVYWSWSADGRWQAPDQPRYSFARAGALYKLYVVQPLGELDVVPEEDASMAFMKSLLPQIGRHIFSDARNSP